MLGAIFLVNCPDNYNLFYIIYLKPNIICRQHLRLNVVKHEEVK